MYANLHFYFVFKTNTNQHNFLCQPIILYKTGCFLFTYENLFFNFCYDFLFYNIFVEKSPLLFIYASLDTLKCIET